MAAGVDGGTSLSMNGREQLMALSRYISRSYILYLYGLN